MSSPLLKNSTNLHNKSIHYRPDIDGLRALAVFAVFIFHAFPKVMKGGFVGVDVFFVISGFLISSIIFTQLENDKFSFWDFYSRRIRRIYPVLLTVLTVSLVLGYFFLINDEFFVLGKHVAGGAAFISNFILYFETGYFDTASHTKPLLHLWSLGIEEQFYIVWPLILWLAWKKRFNLFTISSFIAIISFCLNIYFFKKNASLDFYSPQTRFWELLCGAMLAWANLHYRQSLSSLKNKINPILNRIVYFDSEKNNDNALYQLFSTLGALLLFISIFVIKAQNFPGKWALLPVLATVLIISAGNNGWFNKIVLSNRILVWFGIISYPLYLWHWPLLSFQYIYYGNEPPIWIRAITFPACVLLAWLTTKFIENPLRFGKFGNIKTIALFLLMIAIGVFGYFLPSFLSSRIDKNNQDFEKYFIQKSHDGKLNCDSLFPEWGKKNESTCFLQKPTGKNTIAVVGDSHAWHLFSGLAEQTKGDEGVALFSSPCAAPFLDVMTGTQIDSKRKVGHTLLGSAYDYILNSSTLKYVVLSHNPACSALDTIDNQNLSEKDSLKALENGMRRTFNALQKKNKKILIVLDNPLLPHDPNSCSRSIFFGSGERCSYNSSNYKEDRYIANYNNLVYSVVKDYPGIKVFDLSTLFCDKDNCYVAKDGKQLYRDRNHLNFSGSMYVAPYLMKNIRDFYSH